MSPAVLVIGANGQVGSATVRAALQRSYPTYAFLRNPSKLPADLSSNSSLQVVQGDAKDSQALKAALSKKNPPIDAVVITAPMGDMRGRRSGYEEINQKIIEAVQAEQKESGRKIKVWMMAGSAILEHPEIPGKYLNELMPMTFYPEYGHTIRFLEEKAKDVHWTINAPALIKKGQPVGPLVESITTPPLWKKPFAFTRWIPFKLGYAGNTMYNWTTQNITFQSLGEYMVDNLDLTDRLRHKRVGVLEDPNAKQ